MCDQKTSNLGEDEDDLSVSDDSEPEERPCMASFDPILDHSDEDDNEEEEVRAPVGDQSQFSLKGGGTAFSNRSHSIFDCLDSLAKPSSSSSSSVNQQRDGVFARPQAPPPSRKSSQPPLSPPNPPKRRGAPDYLVHPERWTHYSLEDVSETSDQGNARAALSFLSTLKERKEEVKKEEEDELKGSDSSPSDLQRKMIYSKPSRLRREQPAARSREKEMLLSHLQDEDGEKDEEGKETLKAGGRRAEVEEKQTEDQTEEERQREKGEEKGESSTVFTSFRKMNSKNYRRSSAKEEH